MSAREEELITRLLEEERRRRVEKIVETGKINPEDALVVATLDLNRRVGRVETVMATKDDIRNMATKDDLKAITDSIEAIKDSIRNMRYWLTFAFAILFFGLPVMVGLVMKLFGK